MLAQNLRNSQLIININRKLISEAQYGNSIDLPSRLCCRGCKPRRGAIAVAKACGKSRQAVDKWIHSDKLPRTEYTGETRYAELISELALARGKHLDPAVLRANASPQKSAA